MVWVGADKLISVVLCTMREQMLELACKQFIEQQVGKKELIIVLNNNSIDQDNWKKKLNGHANIFVYKQEESVTLGECLNFGAEKARYDVIAKWDDDDYYSPHYLAKSLQEMRSVNADVIGKAAFFVYFKQEELLTVYRPQLNNRFIHNPKFALAGGTLVFKKNVWKRSPFQPINSGEDAQFQHDCRKLGFKIYSGSHKDYVLIRYPEKHNHSWKIENQLFRKQCKRIAVTDRFEEFVI
ncbi:glycosyltransferase family 2 protein [Neobacillus notoginsengisoli]|uniref:Glycosyltransferase family 2 protein n=1 Tax=Neobacillus notoginsengisoli TaxID=1578198 RepID=A0A417Z0I1_9BACI|nr:glycosyltransferase [Neobacillus notoginsengisoli]RHW43575.1 glycosyltransferase family 2 protein [Neobacillus notoginsengisoli]